MQMYATAYAVIRHRATSPGFSPEWLNTNEISVDYETCRNMAIQTDKETPGWAQENPFARIAHIKITEIS